MDLNNYPVVPHLLQQLLNFVDNRFRASADAANQPDFLLLLKIW